MKLAAFHECLANEYEAGAQPMTDAFNDQDWHATFDGHPHRHKPHDGRQCFPLGLYIDGVRYTKSIGAGKYDSLYNITVHNLASGKRHLVGVVSKKETCKCGCRGWCSLYIIFRFMTWALTHLANGTRPGKNGMIPIGALMMF